MYGPIGGSVGIGPQMSDSPAKLGEPCRGTQTQDELARMEKELARLNELRDALEFAFLRSGQRNGKCAGRHSAADRAVMKQTRARR